MYACMPHPCDRAACCKTTCKRLSTFDPTELLAFLSPEPDHGLAVRPRSRSWNPDCRRSSQEMNLPISPVPPPLKLDIMSSSPVSPPCPCPLITAQFLFPPGTNTHHRVSPDSLLRSNRSRHLLSLRRYRCIHPDESIPGECYLDPRAAGSPAYHLERHTL